jgi:large subunit ribosomal protein L21
MFAVVRTGGKQYRVAPGDKIVVEKLDGNAGDTVTLGDVLLAGDGSELKKTDGLKVSAEIIAQAKGEKVTVFKKRRRHNYRRKKGHRQQHTILRITAIGDHKAEKKPAASKAEEAPKAAKPAKTAKPSETAAAPQVEELETPNPAPNDEAKADPDKGSKAKKAAPATKAAKPASTKNAAPAKGAANKATKSKPPKAK